MCFISLPQIPTRTPLKTNPWPLQWLSSVFCLYIYHDSVFFLTFTRQGIDLQNVHR